jgi:hypothetical protein
MKLSIHFLAVIEAIIVALAWNCAAIETSSTNAVTAASILSDLHYESSAAHLLAFISREDKRPWYVDDALLLLELPKGNWMLVHAVRNPKYPAKLKRPAGRWHVHQVMDAPFVGDRCFNHRPTREEMREFIADNRLQFETDKFWIALNRVIDEKVWQTVLGYNSPVAGSPVGRNKSVIPEIARLAGVQIGYSTQDELAERWGEGEIVTGGHPNSGRVWRVKGTSWVIQTDGFDYLQGGLIIDGLVLGWEPAQNAPFARGSKEDFAWLGGITLGMSRSDVEKFLKSKALASTKTDQGLAVQAKGHHALINSTLGNWTATFDFATNRLSRLSIDAGR